ncbi:hypothetical protein ACFL27_12690 [candidate division CSSED10-310 bacterium]|uniref:CN hydrolase domain-containing protein n=1 Tax=candidate division CSSED10-310 bacterium TaxID=2855610 RepID=A0ABV6YXY5_UNCC1
MDILQKLQSLDRRYIFFLIALTVIIPLVAPLNLKITPSPAVEAGFKCVQDLPEGSKILLAYDFEPSVEPELGPMGQAFIHHCCLKKHKIIGMALWPAGQVLLESALNSVARDRHQYRYGIDYVNLGFMAGNQVVITSLGESFPKTYPRDFDDTPISKIPLMNGIINYSNIDLIIDVSAGDPGIPYWVMYAGTAYGKKVIGGCTAVSAPQLYPYYSSGQLVSLLGGLKGAAEYETLVQYPGSATRGMDAQSVAHMLIIFFVIVGNITFYLEKRRQKTRSRF